MRQLYCLLLGRVELGGLPTGHAGQRQLGVLPGKRLLFGGLACLLGGLGLDLRLHAQTFCLLARTRSVAATGFDQQVVARTFQPVQLTPCQRGTGSEFGDLDPAIGQKHQLVAVAPLGFGQRSDALLRLQPFEAGQLVGLRIVLQRGQTPVERVGLRVVLAAIASGGNAARLKTPR